MKTEKVLAEKRVRSQLEELRRWQAVTVDREERILALKVEVNELLKQLNKEAQYQVQALRLTSNART